jgi:hypothetical protein
MAANLAIARGCAKISSNSNVFSRSSENPQNPPKKPHCLDAPSLSVPGKKNRYPQTLGKQSLLLACVAARND